MNAAPPSPTPFALRRASRQSGFTLVEVSLAIGIVAFSFVSLFGLLPVGMTSFRRSIDTSLTTQIAQRVINDLKQTSFDTVSQIPVSRRYFTEQGDEFPTTGAPGQEKPAAVPGKTWLYSGEISIVNSDGTLLPGTLKRTTSLLTIMIKLASNPGHKESPFTPNSKVQYRTYTSLIARN